MIRQEFESGKKVVFENDGSVTFPVMMTADEFAAFVPLAMHIYHEAQLGQCQPGGNYANMGGKLVNRKITKKRGRPATKTATAKRGRPRTANKE